MKTFVLGDIHGAYRALIQCLERSGFDPERDQLIFLGDAADGWSESPQSLEELMKVKNLVYLLGNHDIWLIEWLLYDTKPMIWLEQGGRATLNAYQQSHWQKRKTDHLRFLVAGRFYHVDDENRLFVHGGIEQGVPLEDQDKELLVWDRQTFDVVAGIPGYREVYIGHSPTIFEGAAKPLNFGGADNIWRLDTGAGWHGRLTIMDVSTKEYWQSDLVTRLYPGEKGRM